MFSWFYSHIKEKRQPYRGQNISAMVDSSATNTRRWPNAELMLAHCLRRWTTVAQHWVSLACLLGVVFLKLINNIFTPKGFCLREKLRSWWIGQALTQIFLKLYVFFFVFFIDIENKVGCWVGGGGSLTNPTFPGFLIFFFKTWQPLN